MAFVLRDYQEHAIERSVAFLTSAHAPKHGGLVVLPTGSGKSLVIANIARRLNAPCLIFQPSKEILEQNASKFLAYGYEPAIYSASMGMRQCGEITLATIGTAISDPYLFDQFPFIMLDEAHHVSAESGRYKSFLESQGGELRVLGLTATPWRLSVDGYGGAMQKFLTRTRDKVFGEVVAYAQIPELMARGFLQQPTYQIVTGFSGDGLKLNTKGSDYDDEGLKRYYNRIGFADRLSRVVRRCLEVGRKHILVFTRFTDEAQALAASVPGMAVVTGDMPAKQREALIEGFRSGEIAVMANVGVLSTGFDFPALDTVVLARPTKSLTLYYQQVGRVLRTHPSKANAWVVDMVDQVRQFGRIEYLWLRAGGKHGTQWEMVSRSPTGDRVLTNQYFSKWQKKARRHPVDIER